MTPNGISKQTVQRKIECGAYSLMSAPRVLVIDNTGVYSHRNGSHQDDVDALENLDWDEKKIRNPKLNGTSFGDYKLTIAMIRRDHFDSRKKLDALFLDTFTDDEEELKNIMLSSTRDVLSLDEALKLLDVTISYDMTNSHDLKCKLDANLEDDLLYSQLVKIFGYDEEEDRATRKTVQFKDFHLLFSDGNDKVATAQRGSHYVLIYYSTS